MRVGIALFWLAVGGPTGVTDAALTWSALSLNTGREIAQLALGPHTSQLPMPSHRGDTGGVVTALFQLPEPLQELGCSFSGTHQSNDSAHTKKARLKPG